MKKRAAINFIASLIYQITSLFIGLLIPKYYTEVFGSAYNGLNQSASQIMSLLSILQFGIAATAIQQMFRYIAVDDSNKTAALYWETGKQYRKMGYLFLIALLPVIILYPFLIKDEVPYTIIVIFLLFRSISSAMEYFFQAKYSILLIAHNKSYVIYIINIVLLFFSTILHIIVLFTFQNIILYQGVALLSTLLRLIIVSSYIKHHFPYISMKTETSGLVKDSQRKDALISEIAGMIINSTDLLVLSTFSGLVSASIYSVYSFVTSGIGNVLSSSREAVFAGIGKTYYSDSSEFTNKMDRFESIYIFLTFYLYSTAILLFRPFIAVYTAKMDANYLFAGFPVLFILSRILVNVRIPSIIAINTAGHFKQVKKYAVIEAIINVVLSIALVKPLGIYGVLVGTIVGAAYRTPLLIGYTNKEIMRRKSTLYWKKILLWIPIFIVCYLLSILFPIGSTTLWDWLKMALIVAIVLLVTCLLWLKVFDNKTLVEILSSVKKVSRRKK